MVRKRSEGFTVVVKVSCRLKTTTWDETATLAIYIYIYGASKRKRSEVKKEMPLGKYYCDYCDKEFQDTPQARKRHLQSTSHLRAKSLWYNQQSFASEDGPRGVCNRFVQTGFCQFGDSCKYLHPTYNSNNLLNHPNFSQGFVDSGQNPIVPGSQLTEGISLPGNMGMPWGNLPPSLKPPPEGGYPPLPFLDWG